jgi:hypothetical protein
MLCREISHSFDDAPTVLLGDVVRLDESADDPLSILVENKEIR